MLKRLVFLAILITSLCACEKEGHDSVTDEDMAKAMERLSFVCTHEADHLPAISEDAQVLYRYALFLESKKGAKDYQQIGRHYRLAYAAGNYKAATNLHNLISQGAVDSGNRSKEAIDIVEHLIAQGIPGGYYDMGHYLEAGYGVKKDIPDSRAYLRKAADLGNPDAQYYIAELLAKVPNTADIMQSMYKCAMEQGHSMAGRRYAGYASVTSAYKDAIAGYQLSTEGGDNISARLLARGFEGPEPSDEFYYLALDKDEERIARYDKISDFLVRHEHLGAKIPDLDDIVPLPPAPLPEWDGTFKWKRDRDSAAPPSPPSEELIQRIAAEKNLDPETGIPLPASK
ncbi:sel1 repeat family protein [Pseudomonas syringae]|uniref:SEL1-like repeat protein n=1 Tax=Pseudomonas syringae TaxID=317 RepID=UPI001F2D65C0|nr:sel1 repeat family protein [Pseudomonas syringae]MBL3829341.1 sel1 repeat family protein [Pseudomonas syringae pv. theae]MBL3835949.1 sel1 repeat family protein [Pseudomonas syringae pv. theae]MBL3869298.1 sel1 repeat family protein [Pseudomonas syringae pv. theae]GKQ47091.1 sel1 repeat family protein [Pseudomonas syringae pv. theae]